MKSPKPQVWKCLIVLMLLVGWVSFDGVATVKIVLHQALISSPPSVKTAENTLI